MKFIQKKYFTIILALISFCLLYLIFKMIQHLSVDKYVIECFNNPNILDHTLNKYLNNSTSHSVDLPLTTKKSCQNFCGPTARCAITGQQCFADIDCPGCKPQSTPEQKSSINVSSNDDAGKLTVGVTPQYSSLTTGYGTRETPVTDDLYSKAPQANFGVNTWRSNFNETQTLFDKRYKPNQIQFMPKYESTYSATGEFVTDGPLPSNY